MIQARIVEEGHVSCVLTGAADGRVKAIAFRSAATALGRELLEARVPLRLAGRPPRYLARPGAGLLRDRRRHLPSNAMTMRRWLVGALAAGGLLHGAAACLAKASAR